MISVLMIALIMNVLTELLVSMEGQHTLVSVLLVICKIYVHQYGLKNVQIGPLCQAMHSLKIHTIGQFLSGSMLGANRGAVTTLISKKREINE